MDAITNAPVPATPLPRRPTWTWRVIRFPLTRIVLGMVFVVATTALVQSGLFQVFGSPSKQEGSVLPFLLGCLVAASGVGGYAVFVRLIEGRRAGELGTRNSFREVLAGSVLGVALMTSV